MEGRHVKAALILLGLTIAVSPAAGAAPKGPRCPLVRAPVCALASDGAHIKVVNACIAEGWKHAKVLHDGDCEAPGKEPAMCNMLYQPVCASDPATGKQKTYPNLCHSEVANAHVLHDGKCAGDKSSE